MKNTENGSADERFNENSISDESLESVSGGAVIFRKGLQGDADSKPKSFWDNLIAMDKGQPLSPGADDEPPARAKII